MRILFLALISFFAFSDNHDEMYEEVYASYLYCSVDEELSDDKARRMWEKWLPAYKNHAEMLDDEVSAVMLFPWNTNEEMRGGDDMFFCHTCSINDSAQQVSSRYLEYDK